ncbi:MAG TPA: prolyl oligopeptidase family serine peptidase [Thermoanaerobaculia bacterium]
MKYAPPVAVVASLLCAVSAAAETRPGTPKIPVSNTYHGVTVVDDYRWLENGDAVRVKAWSEAQNARARAFLDRLPGTAALRARIEHLLTARPASISGLVSRGGRHFAVCSDPARKQQPWIVLLPSLTSTEGMRAIVDPNALDPSGHTSFDWFVPSPDGASLAVSLSEGGSEAGTLHVYDVATGRETGDVIPLVQKGTAGGSAAWTAGGKGLFYTRYPREGERAKEVLDFYQQVFFHTLSTPVEGDRVSFGRELPRIAEISLRASEDGKRHLALVQNGDSGDFALYVLPEGAASWQGVSTFADGVIDARFGPDGSIWAISKKGAPRRRVLRIPAGNSTLAAARMVLDQRNGVIEAIAPTRTRLVTVEALGGKSRVRSYDFEGNLVEELPTPAASAVTSLDRLESDVVFYSVASFLQPETVFLYDAAKKTSTPTVLRSSPVADFSDAEVIEERAISKDGTLVPMFILQPKRTKRDGRNPVVLTGYGGFGVSQRPSYSDVAHVLTARGVVQVSAILRGGGEFGEDWHDAGRLTRKQNVFDDFLACARRLIELNVTRPGRLAIEGGSNGGLLMGAALTQAPKLFRAVVSHVGIYDMLRVEVSSNGQFNTVEYGTTKVPEQFKALYAYSPYHRVRNGTRYPAILMPTGANDPRVDPMQSRKMVARLRAADPRATVLLRTSGSTGHGGIGASVNDAVSLLTDVDAFLLHELGVPPARN